MEKSAIVTGKCVPRENAAAEDWITRQKHIQNAIITTDLGISWTHPLVAATEFSTNGPPCGDNSRHASKKITTHTEHSAPRLIAGCDISFVKDSGTDALSALVVLNYPELQLMYSSFRDVKIMEPYVPGFLAFREAQHIVDLVEELREKRPDLEPDCLLVDGNGLLHPRKCGLACHIGVLCDIPTIGVAKNLLYVDGLTKDRVKACMKENCSLSFIDALICEELVGNSGETHGAALAMPGISKPLFISIGHKISLKTAVSIVVACSRHRIPEPVRQADLMSREILRKRCD